MTKFQRFQKFSSIIPFYSSIFIFIVTMIELTRKKASIKKWLFFVLTFFLSGIVVYILNSFVMSGQHSVLNIIASGLVLAIANIICVDIQTKCYQDRYAKESTDKQQGIFICILAGTFVLFAFTVLLITVFTPSIVIEDSNGSNTNLTTITTEDILATRDNFSAFSSHSAYSGLKTNVARNLQNYDYEKVNYRCKKISGIKILQVTNSDSNQMILNIESTLATGNMEIVIIIDDEYYSNVAVNQAHSIVLNNIGGKNVVVKMAAESAEMSISITRVLN